jgi:diguanylate cyclase (GGDEF)-like protein
MEAHAERNEILANRDHGYETFIAEFNARVTKSKGSGDPVVIALVDLDLFGQVNRSEGPEIGDAVLSHLAIRLVDAIGDTGMVTRYGGDAFAILFGVSEKETAFLTLERFRAGFDGLHVVKAADRSVELSLTVSAGVSAYPDDGGRDQDVIRKASEALYRAKVTGRNKVCLARDEKMVTKTVHYTQGQLHGLSRLSKRMKIGEAALLREALDDLLRKHNA